MSKPDWATRIQKSRQKKYDEGFEAGVLLGYDLGRADMQDKFIKLLEKRKSQVEHSLDRLGAMGKEYWEIQVRILEMSKAIELIKGENK